MSRGVKGGVQVSLGFKRSVRGVLGVKGGVPVSQGVMRVVRVVPGVKGRLGDPRGLKAYMQKTCDVAIALNDTF